MFDVTVLGSANLDLVVQTTRHPRPGETLLGTAYDEHAGGKGLNQAVAAARAGAATAFIGAVGDDEAGRRLRAVANDAHIDVTELSELHGVPTGRALITVDEQGENSIVVVPGANGQVPPAGLRPSRVVLAQLEVPVPTVEALFVEARSRGMTTVLNPAPAADLPPALFEACDIIVPNEHEVELLGGVAALLRHGIRHVIVTQGGNGVDIHTIDDPVVHVAAIDAATVDTTGAGDAFCGYLAARLAADDHLERAVRAAVVAGALAVEQHGAIPSLPTAAAVAARASVAK